MSLAVVGGTVAGVVIAPLVLGMGYIGGNAPTNILQLKPSAPLQKMGMATGATLLVALVSDSPFNVALKTAATFSAIFCLSIWENIPESPEMRTRAFKIAVAGCSAAASSGLLDPTVAVISGISLVLLLSLVCRQCEALTPLTRRV